MLQTSKIEKTRLKEQKKKRFSKKTKKISNNVEIKFYVKTNQLTTKTKRGNENQRQFQRTLVPSTAAMRAELLVPTNGIPFVPYFIPTRIAWRKPAPLYVWSTCLRQHLNATEASVWPSGMSHGFRIVRANQSRVWAGLLLKLFRWDVDDFVMSERRPLQILCLVVKNERVCKNKGANVRNQTHG